jgi:endonuclease/exonuclease/phosphatase family metal-dependent hydrolase
MQKLTILTYNIHKGFGVANLRFVLPKMRDTLHEVNADIICLQEIQGAHLKYADSIKNWPIATQTEFIAQDSWQYHIYAKNASYKQGHHGNAILSKFPFIEWENIDVSKYKHTSRSLLHGIIKIPQIKSRVHIICLHFALFKNERKKQLAQLSKRITSNILDNEPVIVAGDFNDWRNQAEHFLELDLGLKEVFKSRQGDYARTFPAWNPRLAVDRIYYRGLKVTDQQRLHGMPWRLMSDHVPLYAEFALGLNENLVAGNNDNNTKTT